jgi:hypothetical protein
MEFAVAPFTPNLSPKKGMSQSSDAASQLEKLIATMNGQGWEYMRLDNRTTCSGKDKYRKNKYRR